MSLEERKALSLPNFSGFDPRAIPWQLEASKFMRDYDYKSGTPEILLSGSVGSAKSIWMAHQAIRHCMKYPGARVCLARRAMPDLKRTIFNEVLEHIQDDFIEGVHYSVNRSNASIKFLHNNSEIISISWADKRFNKARSLKLSGLVFEELTENNEDDKKAFDTLKSRLRRIVTVPVNFLLAATNPDSPRHWAYKYWFLSDSSTRKVFLSRTEDNPYLDPIYIEQLKRDLDPQEARRLLYGEWVEIDEERIYSAYQTENNFKKMKYQINPRYPVTLAFDFNIGEGKPMSSCSLQFINDEFHVFDVVKIMGADTHEAMIAWLDKGFLTPQTQIIIHGDAAGLHKDSRSKTTDYGIIKAFLDLHRVPYKYEVPLANPPIRTRHNKLNAYCKNMLGQHRLFVYQGAEEVDEGLRLTAFKKGGSLIEDDSKHFQHVTTALGYSVYMHSSKSRAQASSQVMR